MFSGGIKELLVLVLQSWQIYVVTIILVLFMYLVGHLSSNYRPRSVSKAKAKPKTSKPKKAQPAHEPVIIEED